MWIVLGIAAALMFMLLMVLVKLTYTGKVIGTLYIEDDENPSTYIQLDNDIHETAKRSSGRIRIRRFKSRK